MQMEQNGHRGRFNVVAAAEHFDTVACRRHHRLTDTRIGAELAKAAIFLLIVCKCQLLTNRQSGIFVGKTDHQKVH
jgi:hypothetical protein